MIILDNGSSHKTNLAKSWVVESGVEFVFNLPYYPQANPVELFFSELKTRCKEVSTTNHQKLAEEVVKKIKSIPKKNFKSYFKKSFRSCKEKFQTLLKKE